MENSSKSIFILKTQILPPSKVNYNPDLIFYQPAARDWISSLTFSSRFQWVTADSTDVVFLCILSFATVLILIASTYTVFAFWIHRKKLKQTFLLAINLAFADLFVGFTGILTVIGAFAFQRHAGLNNISYNTFFRISVLLHGTFPFISVYFLVLISLERAFALLGRFDIV